MHRDKSMECRNCVIPPFGLWDDTQKTKLEERMTDKVADAAWHLSYSFYTVVGMPCGRGGGYRKSGNDGRNSSVEDWIPYSSTFSYLLNVAVSLRAPCRRSRWEVDVTESNSPFWLTTSFPGYTLPAGHLRQCICTTDRASREVGHAIQPWTRLDRLCVVSTKEALPHGHCLAIVCASKGKVSRAKTLSLLVLPYNNNNYIYCQLPHPEKYTTTLYCTIVALRPALVA